MTAPTAHTGSPGTREAPAAENPSATVALQGLEGRLSLYYRALCDRGCALVPDDTGTAEPARPHPDTDTTLRLPPAAPLPPDGGPADTWYRVAVAHRALHHELGTFGLSSNRAEPFFRRLRPLPPDSPEAGDGLEEFFGQFGRPALAVEVFTALEDLRVDEAGLRRMPGLAGPFDWVRREELAARPDPVALPPRSALAEVLVRLTLGATRPVLAGSLHARARALASLALPLRSPGATVETTAEATVRAYSLLARLPNLTPASDPPAEAELAGDPDPAAREDPGLGPHTRELRLEGDEVFDVRFAPVRYRDVPGPRYLGQHASGMPMREAVLRTTEQHLPAPTPEEDNSRRSQDAEAGGPDVTDTSRPAPPPEPLPHDHGPDLDGHHHAVRGALTPNARGQYVYPEWDGFAGRYLHDWCLVRTSRAAPGRSARVHREAVRRHRDHLPALVAALERLSPAALRRTPRSRQGDDLDLDACIEAMADLRRGETPGDRLHVETTRSAREVAVAFAVDLSSSTAERLPPDPRRPGEVRRILDVEREAVALLMAALDRVGDTYGVYGFSGTGREDVRIRTVKGLDERPTPAVLRRLDGLRPHHTTRMGPAVRHLTGVLARREAATRLLLIVSDGRPYDLDYGQSYADRHPDGEGAVLEYALHDTAKALAEARAAGVRPYLVTVDPAGEDYLGEICAPHEYHVIRDPRDLPASLAALYLAARRRASSGGDGSGTHRRAVPPSDGRG